MTEVVVVKNVGPMRKAPSHASTQRQTRYAAWASWYDFYKTNGAFDTPYSPMCRGATHFYNNLKEDHGRV